MKNRRLKSINVFFDISNTPVREIENIPNFKELVYGELYGAVEEAKDNIATLFEVNNSGYILELKDNDWVPALQEAISFYEKREEFEKCALYQKLINKLNEKRNQLNTRSGEQPVERPNSNKKEKIYKSTSRKKVIRKNNR